MQYFFSYYILRQQTILADVTVGCQSNGRRVSSISDLLAPAAKSSVDGTACSRLPWPAVLPGRTHCPIIYSHPWLVYPSTHPHLLLFSSDDSRTSQPSYSPPHGQPLLCLPQLRVIPFIGLAIVHHPGALNAVWLTWSRNDFQQKSTIHAEDDSWVHDRSKEVPPYYAENNDSST